MIVCIGCNLLQGELVYAKFPLMFNGKDCSKEHGWICWQKLERKQH